MSSPVSHLPRLAVASLLLLAGGSASAQLATNSPFQPRPSSTPAVAVADAQFKYGGYVQTVEGMLFRVSDPGRKLAAFLKLNQRDDALGVVIKSHDAQSNAIVIEHNGRTITLAEPKAKITQGPGPMPVTVNTQAGQINVSSSVVQAVVANPTQADEQGRLDAVAAEIARRRAMREQSATAPAGATPQPQAR